MSSQNPIVLFVCEHGSAKSTIAAAHFNKLARERGLNVKGISRGTDPDESFPTNVTAGLRSDGLQAEESRPKRVRDSDFAAAACIVVFSELPTAHSTNLRIHDWSDVPPVSEDYGIARDEILKRMDSVIEDLRPDIRRQL